MAFEVGTERRRYNITVFIMNWEIFFRPPYAAKTQPLVANPLVVVVVVYSRCYDAFMRLSTKGESQFLVKSARLGPTIPSKCHVPW